MAFRVLVLQKPCPTPGGKGNHVHESHPAEHPPASFLLPRCRQKTLGKKGASEHRLPASARSQPGCGGGPGTQGAPGRAKESSLLREGGNGGRGDTCSGKSLVNWTTDQSCTRMSIWPSQCKRIRFIGKSVLILRSVSWESSYLQYGSGTDRGKEHFRAGATSSHVCHRTVGHSTVLKCSL